LRQRSHSGTWPGRSHLPPSRMPLNGTCSPHSSVEPAPCCIVHIGFLFQVATQKPYHGPPYSPHKQALTTARVKPAPTMQDVWFVNTKHFFIVSLSHSQPQWLYTCVKRWIPQNATKSFRQKTDSEFSCLSGEIELHVSHVYCSFILFAHFVLHSHFTFIYIPTIWFRHNAHHSFLVVQVCITL
jgi:hypothetical protein